ncbi:hypothetical protein ABPG74_014834 [Tetrahymena malaccensis]
MASKEIFKFTGLPRIENKPLFKQIDKVAKENEQKYGIEYFTKGQKFAFQETIRKATFKNGWYCYYTDNQEKLKEGQSFHNNQIVVTIHGWPGDPKEMAGLQQTITDPSQNPSNSLLCRWINFMVPGMDGEMEIFRGDYHGYLDELGDLIMMLLRDHLQINRQVISLGYSGGTVMWRFCHKKYPKMFKAHINIAGPTILWIPAHTYMYSVFNRYDQEYGLRKNPELFESIEFRRHLFQRFKSDHDGNYFEFENVPIMCNDPETLMIWFKAFMTVGEEGWTEYYQMGHNDLPILKFYCCGEFDPLIDTDLMRYEYYFYTYIKQRFELMTEAEKDLVRNDPILNKITNFNFDNVQENFIFVMKKTGHTIHTKRSRELSKPMRCFIQLIEKLPVDYYYKNAIRNPPGSIPPGTFLPKL